MKTMIQKQISLCSEIYLSKNIFQIVKRRIFFILRAYKGIFLENYYSWQENIRGKLSLATQYPLYPKNNSQDLGFHSPLTEERKKGEERKRNFGVLRAGKEDNCGDLGRLAPLHTHN